MQRRDRYAKMLAFLETVPCYRLYVTYAGQPPVTHQQLSDIQHHIHNANEAFKAGVNEDWRRCCMEYPRILDYYFGLVDINFPSEHDGAIQDPIFAAGGSAIGDRRSGKPRKHSKSTEHRKKERRRSRGRTPPPPPPMVSHYRRP